MTYVYLDTSRLRALANEYRCKYWSSVHKLLKSSKCTLLLSIIHLYEFAQRKLKAKDVTAHYLSSLENTKWILNPWDLFREETNHAVNYILENSKKKMRDIVIKDSFLDLLQYFTNKRLMKSKTIPDIRTVYEFKYDLKQPKDFYDVVNIFVKHGLFNNFKHQLDQDANRIARLNTNAPVCKDPTGVLMLHIKAYLPDRSESNKLVPRHNRFLNKLVSNADELIPSLKFHNDLQKITLSRKRTQLDDMRNDLVDDYHACYIAYCDAMIHDRGTCDRARRTDSVYAKKIVTKPKDFLNIISP